MKCKTCGEEIHHENVLNGHLLVDRQLCFSCNFWHEIRDYDEELGPHKFAIIDGQHYYLNPKNTPSKGFDGFKFKIKFKDGFETTCDNLWTQGKIPIQFIDWFPNNADFVK